jgi:hypothetical protein
MEWLAAGRPTSSEVACSNLTISEICHRYWQFAKQHYRKNGKGTSEQDNIRYALRPLRQLYGRASVKDFGPLGLKSLQTKMIEEGLSRGVINARIGKVKRMFRWAVSEELAPASLVHSLDAVTSDEFRHVPTGTLARLVERMARVFASASTWYRLIRLHRWRRPCHRVHPAKPCEQPVRMRSGTLIQQSSVSSTAAAYTAAESPAPGDRCKPLSFSRGAQSCDVPGRTATIFVRLVQRFSADELDDRSLIVVDFAAVDVNLVADLLLKPQELPVIR